MKPLAVFGDILGESTWGVHFGKVNESFREASAKYVGSRALVAKWDMMRWQSRGTQVCTQGRMADVLFYLFLKLLTFIGSKGCIS